MTRAILLILMLFGMGLLLASVVFPGIMLVAKFFEQVPATATISGDASVLFPTVLLLRSVGLAALGATLACAAAVPGIVLVGRAFDSASAGFVLGLLLVPLVLPPLVSALGWRSWLSLPGELRCVCVWSGWCWPIASFVVGGAWSRRGRRLYEVALLNSSPVKSFLQILASVLVRPIAASWLLMFAIFLGDYSVPHACDTIVYATVLLSEATSSQYPIATVKAAMPMLVPMFIAIVATYILGLRGQPGEGEKAATTQSTVPRGLFAVVVVMVMCTVALPLLGLAQKVELWSALSVTWQVYGSDILYSLVTVTLAGVCIVWIGVCVVTWSPTKRIAPLLILLWAVMPGALVGEAVISAFLPLDAIYNHWLLTVIGYIARFGWIGVLCAQVVISQTDESTMGAALVDGASGMVATWRIALGNHWPTLIAGALIAGSMSLAEVSTTALVRVPVFTPASLVLIEKFHRFEDDILVALCILLLIAACPGIALVAMAQRWRS